MFDNKRYVTVGINREIPIDLQETLWRLIDRLKQEANFKLDYLQVFDIKPVKGPNGNLKQEIIHRQEQPAYQKSYYPLSVTEPLINVRVFVIDDGTHTTMLLAEEY